MAAPVPARWAPGDAITARRLNDMMDATRPPPPVLSPPTSISTSSGETPAPGIGSGPVATAWTETSRTTSVVRVFNPADSDQYVDVDRIDTVTLADAAGNTMTLIFTGA